MFTGIIEGIGEIEAISAGNREGRFLIRPHFSLKEITDGASIAVDGVCLSIEKHNDAAFEAYASQETLSRTNLSGLAPGAKVNLEQAMRLGARLDGHIVTGHVDCLATLLSIHKIGESLKLRLEYPQAYSPFIIPKGSVALNGISLTINECGSTFLEVNLIPDSQRRTTLPYWRPGAPINMETDIIGKYVCHMVQPWQRNPDNEPGLDFLAEHGFL